MIGLQLNGSPGFPQSVATPGFYTTFLKGEPKALGAVQISLALFQVALGTVLVYTLNAYTTITVYSGVNFWGALFYIISGSLSVSASKKQSRGLIKGNLVMNIFSALASLSGIVLFSMDIPLTYYFNYGPCYTTPCNLFQNTILTMKFIILGFLLIGTVLQFTISISISVFSCRALSNKDTDPPQVIVLQNPGSIPMSVPGVPVTLGTQNVNAAPNYN